MNVEVLGLVISLVIFWSALIIGAMKWLWDGYTQALVHRFEQLEQNTADQSAKWQELERRIATEYVRREDWVRFGGTIDAKMDRLSGSMDTLKEMIYARRD